LDYILSRDKCVAQAKWLKPY